MLMLFVYHIHIYIYTYIRTYISPHIYVYHCIDVDVVVTLMFFFDVLFNRCYLAV